MIIFVALKIENYITSRSLKNWPDQINDKPKNEFLTFSHKIAAYPGDGNGEIGNTLNLYKIDSAKDQTSKEYYFIDPWQNRRTTNSPYRIVSNHIENGKQQKTGIIIYSYEGKHELLIAPIFDAITIKEDFNLFLCESFENVEKKIGKRYYFDTIGRFIYNEPIDRKSSYPPTIAYDPIENEIIHNQPLPESLSIYRVIDPRRYVVITDEKYLGTVNYKGEWLIAPNYKEIIYSKNHVNAFVRKDYDYYYLDQVNQKKKKLPYYIWNQNENFVQITTRNKNHETPTVGLMNFNGELFLNPIYSNIYFTHDPNRILLCVGDQEYIHGDYSIPRTIGTFDCVTRLNLGQIGLIDQNKNKIIPIEFDYIAEISLGYYVANKHGEIFDCETHHGKKDDPYIDNTTAIKGGSWTLFDNDGIIKNVLNSITAHNLLQNFQQKNKIPIIVLE